MSDTYFISIGEEIGRLVTEKNIKYGDSFQLAGEILKVLYPNGVNPEQYGDMLGVVRVIDKLFRIATDDKSEEPWKDIAGYGVLGVARKRKKGA